VVATRWEAVVEASLAAVKAEAERRVSSPVQRSAGTLEERQAP
jgi:hypothetical protein